MGYALCAVGGALSCGITHTAVTPLDLVKCRLQVNKEKYKNLGNGFKVTFAEGGASGLFLGWAPTAIGYTMQGICKFGFYEVFENVYGDMIGEENAYLYRTSLYLAASASAEFFANIALSPMESCKVRIQTSPVGTFPTTLRGAFPKIKGEEGLNGFYKSVGPSDPLHHDEVRLLREDGGGHLPVRGAQAPRRVQQVRAAGGHLRRGLHRGRVLRHRVPPRRHPGLLPEQGARLRHR